jgi:AraC-like DNA-binding protein
MGRDWLTTLLARGLSVEKIAQRFGKHPSTVSYWMAKYGLEAPNHDKHAPRGGGYYRCGRCRAESVASHRRRLKALLIDEAGGRCILCGYDREPRALEFHHVDPAQKAFNLSRKGITLSVQALRAEARKCVLLCSNCHAEVEGGFVVLPDTIRGSSAESVNVLEIAASLHLNPG